MTNSPRWISETSLNHLEVHAHVVYNHGFLREGVDDGKVATRTKKRRVRGHLSLLDNLYGKLPLRSTTFNFHWRGTGEKKTSGEEKAATMADDDDNVVARERHEKRVSRFDDGWNASRESFSSRSFPFSSFRCIRRVSVSASTADPKRNVEFRIFSTTANNQSVPVCVSPSCKYLISLWCYVVVLSSQVLTFTTVVDSTNWTRWTSVNQTFVG